jgi:lysophospholipase L1-like esterase
MRARPARWIGAWLALGAVTVAGCAKTPSAPDYPGSALGPKPIGPPAPPTPIATYTRYMTFGDSETEGKDVQGLQAYDPGVPASYPFKLQKLLTARYAAQTIQVQNSGKGGRRAADSFDDLTSDLATYRPEVTILLDGVNDLNGGANRSDVIDEMRVLCQAILSRGSQLILSTLPPERPGGSGAFAPGEIVPYNQALAQLAKSLNIPLVDIYPLITTPLADGLLGPDGLHPTDAGNAKIAQAFLDKIKSMWETPGVVMPDAYRILPIDQAAAARLDHKTTIAAAAR